MFFWITIGALALGCSAILGLAMVRGRIGEEHPAAYDLRVYEDQLKEVERDLARGVITPEDAERTRTEVSRRVLAADAQLRAGDETDGQPRTTGLVLAAGAVLLLMGGALALYRVVGVPGYQDVPRAARIAASEEARQDRLTQAEVESRLPPVQLSPDVPEDYLQLMQRLRDTVAERPDDLRGLMLLARNEAALGNLPAAHMAQARVIELKGDAASADDYAELVDLMVSAAGGYVSVEAEQAVRAALRRNPEEPRARYYLGLYMMQIDRPDTAFRLWDGLLRESRADAPWVPIIRDQMEELAYRAGQHRYELPPLDEGTAPGPSQDDIEAAGEMSAEERAQMIRGMVQGLSERLASEGGPPEEWARLINAYGVLGETDQARAIWANAQEVFAETPDALEVIRNAARTAGVAE